MKALTLWQPWASLVALGAKTLETRGWSTRYRGPLAVHAAKRPPDQRALLDLTNRLEAWDLWYGAGLVSEDGRKDHIPRGVVVATCDLVDVVPIIEPDLSDYWPPEQPSAAAAWSSANEPGWAETVLVLGGGREPRRFPGQRHLGDFSPGRFAWVLEDIQPIDPPVPARGRQGLWEWAE